MLNIFTYATHEMPSPWFRVLLERLEVDVLPIDLEWTQDFYAKAYSFSNRIKLMKADDLVMCVDAFDVVPTVDCTKEALEEMLLSNFSMKKLVFNAEKFCYPDETLKSKYPETKSDWRYLNAGIVVGKVEVFQEVYSKVLPRIKGSMDQLEFTKEYLDGGNIELDSECLVFQTLMGECVDDFTFENGKGKNNLTDTFPLLWHGNGTSHRGLNRLLL